MSHFPTMNDIISDTKVSRRIFYHLNFGELDQCATVCKLWYQAVQDARSHAVLNINVDLIKKLAAENKKLEQYIEEENKFATKVDITGWSRGIKLPPTLYDKLFTSNLNAKRLVLRGRGVWDTCRCPIEGSNCANVQIDTVKSQDLTKLESIHIATTFYISSCALLDLVSRSPNLKEIKLYGCILNPNHNEKFNRKRFYCDLERVYWPWSTRKNRPTLLTLVKRNENITTFFSTAESTCDLLSSDALNNLKYLSLNLNENWNCKPGNHKKVYKYQQKIKYLSQAKNLEALEIRTFDLNSDSTCEETNRQVEMIYDTYKLAFWEEVAKLKNLKYLAIYGAWELENVCREISKHGLQVEYLKMNLLPRTVITALENEDDNPVLSMVDGIKYIRKLTKLRSLHYICCEKLGSIDHKTTNALKEVQDILWNFDIKTCFTEQIEDLLNNLMRRGNQLGKTYNFYLHIQSKATEYADILTKRNLKFPLNTDLKAKLGSISESETAKRYGKPIYDSFHIWGIQQTDNTRDRQMYERISSSWRFYNDKFHLSLTVT